MVNVSNNGVRRQLCGFGCFPRFGCGYAAISDQSDGGAGHREESCGTRGGLQAWRAVQTLSMSGKYPVQIYYLGYKTVSGLMIPYVMERKVQRVKQSEKIEIENVAVNPRVEDSRFAKLQ